MATKTLLTADELEQMPGCQIVLVVSREVQQIDVFKADGSEHTLTTKDVLEIPELLPGFSVKVGDLFE